MEPVARYTPRHPGRPMVRPVPLWRPAVRGKTRLVLGHESLGRVIDPGPSSSLKKGDLVVGIVRRPDPVPCPNCAVGEWDMCRNGQYTERGIKEIDGFMSERWPCPSRLFRLETPEKLSHDEDTIRVEQGRNVVGLAVVDFEANLDRLAEVPQEGIEERLIACNLSGGKVACGWVVDAVATVEVELWVQVIVDFSIAALGSYRAEGLRVVVL